MKRIVVVDRDGTIIKEPADQQIDSLEKLEYVPGIFRGLSLLADAGFSLIMASNQDGLGTQSYPRIAYDLVQSRIIKLLGGEGIRFEKIFICPHLPSDGCRCRKPQTGLLDHYLKRNAIDRANSFVLGDRETDVLLARNLGFRSARLTAAKSAADYRTKEVFDACRWIVNAGCSATLERTTGETNIKASVLLRGSGKNSIHTGIHFFDHMLSQLSRHSSVDIDLHASGDLEVDEHHTVEDTGIVLGESMRKALGNKKGLERFGFSAPLDEAKAETVLDLCGRSYLEFDCSFKREKIGDLPSELIEDFFKAFADGIGASIHIRCSGRNDHHKAEAIFKSVARALKQAVRIDENAIASVPSTKGAL